MTTSPSAKPSKFCMPSHWQRFATRFLCVSITPLGRPVVPLEYGRTTRSFAGSMRTAGGSTPVASNSAKGRAPSAVPNTKISSIALLLAASFALSRNGGTVIRKRARESTSCLASSSAVYSGLAVVLMPPSEATASKTTAYSGRLGL